MERKVKYKVDRPKRSLKLTVLDDVSTYPEMVKEGRGRHFFIENEKRYPVIPNSITYHQTDRNTRRIRTIHGFYRRSRRL